MKYSYRGGVLYSNSYSIFYWAGTSCPDYSTRWTVVRWGLIEPIDGLEFV